MSVLRKTETQFDRSTDPLWWGLAALLGLTSLWLPQFLQMRSDPTTHVLVTEAALFFSGTLIGSLRPKRVWRWGAAAFLAFALKDLVQSASEPGFAWVASPETFALLFAHASVYAVETIPVLAGAYLGAYMMRAGLK